MIDDEALSNQIQAPQHKQVTNEQLSNGPEMIKSSQVTKCLEMSLSNSESNKNDPGVSNEEHLQNPVKKTVDTDDAHYNKGTPGKDHEAFPLAFTKSTGIVNNGFDCNETKSASCSPDQITVAKEDEVNIQEAMSQSLE